LLTKVQKLRENSIQTLDFRRQTPDGRSQTSDVRLKRENGQWPHRDNGEMG